MLAVSETEVTDQTSEIKQPEISEIQNDVALTAEQIRKIFEGYIGGACGLANIFCDCINED